MSYVTRKLKTAPAAEPLSRTEAKLHLRVDGTDEDALIDELIVIAREFCETYTERSFITQTWEAFYDCFPDVFELPRPPLASVVSITYVDTNGDSQVLSSAVYTVDTDSTPGRVYLAYGQSWPSTRSIRHAVTVEYTAGYGADDTNVPKRIKQAMRLLVGHLYENREAVVVGMSARELPLALKALLASVAAPEAM